jgi:hypothetical protein
MVGKCPTSELTMLCDELERLWDESERARNALDAHIWDHCCTVRNPASLPQTCRSRFSAML